MDTHSTTAHHHTLPDFFPLIGMFAVVVVATAVTLYIENAFSMLEAMRVFMGYFFLLFGALKVIRWKGFIDAFKEYDIVAKRSSVYARAYPLVEISLAVLFLSGAHLIFASIFTLVIMGTGAWGVYLKLRKKEEIPCACMGTVFKVPMTHATLFEDLLMFFMAAGMLVALI